MMEVDNGNMDNENMEKGGEENVAVVEVGSVREPGIMKSFLEASTGANVNPAALVRMGHYMRLLQGRYFFLRSSQLTNEYLNSHDYSEIMASVDLKNAVSNYQSYVNAHLIKRSLQMHPFYSYYSANIIARNRKNAETFKTLESLYRRTDTLSESVNKLTDIYNEYLEQELKFPAFYNRCLAEIEDHRATLQQQNIDKDAKEMLAEKKSEVRFLAEISSRLLSITLLEDPRLCVPLIDVSDVLNQVQ